MRLPEAGPYSGYRLKWVKRMQIGELARASDCRVVTIRYYERIGVLPPAGRAPNNYRQYDESHLRRLRFVRRMRNLGFPLENVRKILRLIEGGAYTCDDVHFLAQEHLDEVRERLEGLQRMEAALANLVDGCRGGQTPNCAMLESLFADGAERPAGPCSPRT